MQRLELDRMVKINVGNGRVEGIDAGEVLEFRGIRFAEPPVGELRFRPPVLRPVTGDVDATSYGNRAAQAPAPEALGGVGPGEPDEDCLFLNVTTPAADGARRPVLCWIHGGAFTLGSANDYPAVDLAAANDLVVVTVNYRLGMLGFLDVSGLDADEAYAGSANHGIADQITALQWIRDHIADFGGDPDDVTIAGESAGAMSVMSLLASPAADGLYAKAMANSTGGLKPAPIDVASLVEPHLSGDGPLLERLRSADTATLLAVQQLAGFGFGGCIDGTIVTRTMSEAAADRSAAGVPLLIGSNLDEGTLFHAIAGFDESMFDLLTSALPEVVAGGAGADRYLASLEDAHPDADLTARNLMVWNEFFRRPAVDSAAVATEHGAGGWLYRFELPSTAFGGALGACHAGEIAFTFNWFAGDGEMPGWTFHDRTDDTKALADAWSSAVARFVRTGDPNGEGLPEWPRYSSDDRRVLVIDSPLRIDLDPDETARKRWSELS